MLIGGMVVVQVLFGAVYCRNVVEMNKANIMREKLKGKESEVSDIGEYDEESSVDAVRFGFKHKMSGLDKGVFVTLLVSPYLLLGVQRFTSKRWIHQISLVSPVRAKVKVYGVFGNLVTRHYPVSVVTRGKGRHIYIEGKTHLMGKEGEWRNRALFLKAFSHN